VYYYITFLAINLLTTDTQLKLYGKCIKIRHIIITNMTHNSALGFNQYKTTRPKFTTDNKATGTEMLQW
jgi:hypothetical protein